MTDNDQGMICEALAEQTHAFFREHVDEVQGAVNALLDSGDRRIRLLAAVASMALGDYYMRTEAKP